jgi:hypothetical protein
VSQQINLFNPIFLKQKKYFSAVTMAQSLGLLILGIALVVAYANYQLLKLRKEAASVTAQLNASQAQLVKLNAEFGPRQKNKSLAEEILKNEAEVKDFQQVFETLRKGEFGNTKGYSEYLRAYSRQIVGGLWLTGLSIYGAGNEIGINGRATKPELIPVYISRLKSESVMQGKTFAALEMQVPEAAQVNKTDSTAAKPAGLANFIDFNLQSSPSVKESAGTSTVGSPR